MSKPSNGYGSYTFSDGNKYTGQWKDGEPNGRGKLELPNGDIYEGDFSYGLKKGNGVYRSANGTIYDGSWKNDRREGRGVLTYAVDGKVSDFFCGGPGCSYNAKDKIDGVFKENKRHGACTYTFFNGETFPCTFVEGRCDEFNIRQAAVRAAPDAASVQARRADANARAVRFL